MHSYPKIYNLGSPEVKDFLKNEVYVEEKVDGSQLSFGVFDGVLSIKSKSTEINEKNCDKMFSQAIITINTLAPYLMDGWTYRCEYLKAPRHNALAYNRVPHKHLALFDINKPDGTYSSYDEKQAEADRLGIDIVPIIFEGFLTEDRLDELLDRISFLGGQKIEGLVIKNHTVRDKYNRAVIAKYVAESFREIRKTKVRIIREKFSIIDELSEKYCSEARWNKAILHLKEKGQIKNDMSDIGLIIREHRQDLIDECAEMIKNDLYDHFHKDILHNCGKGIPEWYRGKLNV